MNFPTIIIKFPVTSLFLAILLAFSASSASFANSDVRTAPAGKGPPNKVKSRVRSLKTNTQAKNRATPAKESSEEESGFRGLEFKCKEEKENGPDTTPQSPPLIIDDPGTPGCNKWEINFTFDADISTTEKHIESPLLDVNYGIGDNLQLKFEIPELIDHSEEKSTSGLGDPKFGVKYLFYKNEKSDVEIGFYPQIEIARAKEESGQEINLPILMTKKIGETKRGSIVFALNATYTIANQKVGKDFISLASGLGLPLTRSIAFMAEISTDQALKGFKEEEREQIIIANIGLKGPLTETISLYASTGLSLVSSDGQQHFFGLTGVQWTP